MRSGRHPEADRGAGFLAVAGCSHAGPPRRRRLRAVPALLLTGRRAPRRRRANGAGVAAPSGASCARWLSLLDEGATHLGAATDHVIKSFRNQLFDGYKGGDSIEPEASSCSSRSRKTHFAPSGLCVWPMVEFEADDALAAGVATYRAGFDQVCSATPDKDLAQCVRGRQGRPAGTAARTRSSTRRRPREVRGRSASSIPDYLALVGDKADGIPGLPGWGAKSTAAVLARIPPHPGDPARSGPMGSLGSAARRSWRPRSRSSETWRCSSSVSRPSTPRSMWERSTTGTGPVRPPTSRTSATASTCSTCSARSTGSRARNRT